MKPVFIFITLAALTLALAPAGAALAKGNPMVTMQTNLGEFTIELYPDKAPKTVENFLNYVNRGFYTGTTFHRVVPGFVIQGGGLNASMQLKATDKPIKNEADNGLKNLHYTLSMARTNDPDSASSQFFVNLADNPFLDHTSKTVDGWGYAVFGKVVKGMEVVDKIGAVPTTSRGYHKDVPKEPVVIESAKLAEEAAGEAK